MCLASRGEQWWPRDYWHMVSCWHGVSLTGHRWSLPISQCLFRTGAVEQDTDSETLAPPCHQTLSGFIVLTRMRPSAVTYDVRRCRTLELDPQQEMIGTVISCQKMIASLSIMGHIHQKQIIKRIKLEHLQNWDELPVVRNQSHSEIVEKHWNAPTRSSHLCCKKSENKLKIIF